MVRKLIHHFNIYCFAGIEWHPYWQLHDTQRYFLADVAKQIAEVALSSPKTLIGTTQCTVLLTLWQIKSRTPSRFIYVLLDSIRVRTLSESIPTLMTQLEKDRGKTTALVLCILAALSALAICPPVLGPIASSDGHIGGMRNLLILWSFTSLLFGAALAMLWLRRTASPLGHSIRNRFGRGVSLLWARRYFIIWSAGMFIVASIVTFQVLVWRANHIDPMRFLQASHAPYVGVFEVWKDQGRSAAMTRLGELLRSKAPAVRIPPYQVWHTTAEVSAYRRREFLLGNIGRAAGIDPSVRWRPGEAIPYGRPTDVAQPFLLHRQCFLFHILRDRDADDYAAALEAATIFVSEWRRGNRLWPNRNRFAWNDDVTANRITAHMMLMDQRRLLGLTTPEEETHFLRSLIQHANQMMDERLYTSGTNHGMMQNAALLQIAVAYPEFDREKSWLRTAVRRTEEYVKKSFTEEGVCLELAPSYHYVNTQMLLWFVATCEDAGVLISPHVERTVRRALVFCREVLQPDRSLPMIADTREMPVCLEGWPFAVLPQWKELSELHNAVATAATMPNDKGARFWPDAGYFILRAGPEAYTRDSAMMVVLKTNSKSRAHAHSDALSLTFFANGRPLLSGPGYPDYEPSTNRLAVLSTANQNTISVDGKAQDLATADVVFCVTDTSENKGELKFAAISARGSFYPQVWHQRTLCYGPTDSGILIVDELRADQKHQYRQHFRGSLEVLPTLDSDTFLMIGKECGNPLLRIHARVVADESTQQVTLAQSDSMCEVLFSGEDATYITLLEASPASIELPRIDATAGSISWDGPTGSILIELPIKSKSDVVWISRAADQAVE